MYRVYLFVIGICICCPLIGAKEPLHLLADPTPTVTLDMKRVPLQDILLEIEKQTGLFFSYESSMLKEFRHVSLTARDESLSYCLKRLFEPGASSDEVIEHYKKADYSAKDYYKKNPKIKAAVDFITGKQMMKIGCKESLERLQKELIGKDWFMTFLDFDAYKKAKDKALAAYTDQKEWAKKMLVNIAEAGYFSSDRTIEQYNRDIWKLTRS